MHPQDPRRHLNHPENDHATPTSVEHISPGLHRRAERDPNPSGSGGNRRYDTGDESRLSIPDPLEE